MMHVDIRIQFVLALIGVLFFSVLILPDRYDKAMDGVRKFSAWGLAFLAAFVTCVAPTRETIIQVLGPVSSGNFWGLLNEYQKNPGLIPVIAFAVYFALGLAWAIGHFWLYARRLGHLYVLERDAWLRARGLKSLADLPKEAHAEFQAVLEKVKSKMHYEGDFPLQPLQQKRFFVANLMLWPVTLLYYLLGDVTVDVARYIWFAFRGYITKRWEAQMGLYLADDARCQEFFLMEKEKKKLKTS